MDKSEAAEHVRGWRAERAGVDAELRAIQAKANGLDKLIEGIEVMFPDLALSHGNGLNTVAEGAVSRLLPDGPKATDGVRGLLRSNPHKWFSGRDMMNAFAAEGYDATETAIRLALKRAHEKGFADMQEGERGKVFRFHSEADRLFDTGVSTP